MTFIAIPLDPITCFRGPRFETITKKAKQYNASGISIRPYAYSWENFEPLQIRK